MTSENKSERNQPRSAGAIKHRRVQLPWPDGKDFRILAIDGGGIRGIYPATFLAGLEERYLDGRPITQYFDMIAGTSTGGIIALGLAAGLKSSDIRDIYIGRGKEIFPPLHQSLRFVGSVSQLFKYRYNEAGLERVLSDSFGDRKFGEAKVRLCIPSCDGEHGEVFIFKTPHHSDYKHDRHESMKKVALATSAAPTYFRLLEDGYFTFADGGVWCNNPTMVGLVDALACYDVRREHIRILSLGCGKQRYRFNRFQKRLGGMLYWLGIISHAMQFQSLNALGQARLLIGANRVKRVNAHLRGKPIAIDDWTRASKELPIAAETSLDKCGNVVASQFLQEPVEPYRPTI